MSSSEGSLDRWFRQQREKEGNSVLLEDALLGGSFSKYYSHRLRLFLLRTFFVCALHFLEVRVLLSAFQDFQFFKALGFRTIILLVGTAWWAGLESMRGEIRRQKRDEKPYLIPRILSRWLSLAKRLSSLIFATAFLAALVITLETAWTPLRLYTWVCVLRLGVEILMRTYHSGVYATRRVYRPLHWILLAEAVSVGLFYLLKGYMGAWALAPLALITGGISTYISYFYLRRIYDFVGYTQAMKELKRKKARPYPFMDFKLFRRAAIAFSLFKLDSLLLLVLAFKGPSKRAGDFGIYLALILGAPLLQAAQEWGQLLYFDFKRLELDSHLHLRKRFESGLGRLPLILAALLWLPLPLMMRAILPDAGLASSGLVFLLIVPYTYLSLEVVRVFSDGHYARLLLCSAGLLGGLLATRLVPDLRASIPFLITLSVLLWIAWGALALSERISRTRFLGQHRPQPLLNWLSEVKKSKSVAVAWMRLPVDETSWRTQQLASRLAMRLAKEGGRVTILSDEKIALCVRGDFPHLQEYLLTEGAGWIEDLHVVEGPVSPSEAIDKLFAKDFSLRRSLATGASRGRAAGRDANRLFRQLFPQGLILDLTRDGHGLPAHVTASDRRELLTGAMRYIHRLPEAPERGANWDITAWGESGRLSALYAVPLKKAPSFRRLYWRRWITRRNIASAWKGGAGVAPQGLSSDTEKNENE